MLAAPLHYAYQCSATVMDMSSMVRINGIFFVYCASVPGFLFVIWLNLQTVKLQYKLYSVVLTTGTNSSTSKFYEYTTDESISRAEQQQERTGIGKNCKRARRSGSFAGLFKNSLTVVICLLSVWVPIASFLFSVFQQQSRQQYRQRMQGSLWSSYGFDLSHRRSGDHCAQIRNTRFFLLECTPIRHLLSLATWAPIFFGQLGVPKQTPKTTASGKKHVLDTLHLRRHNGPPMIVGQPGFRSAKDIWNSN